MWCTNPNGMNNFCSVDLLKVKPAFWIHKSLGWFHLWQVTIIVGFNLKWFQYFYGWSWPWWTLREIQHIAVHCNQNSTMCLLYISKLHDIQLGISFVLILYLLSLLLQVIVPSLFIILNIATGHIKSICWCAILLIKWHKPCLTVN